eukprot:1142679-Pelagomonas_calceolata.AAC.9
MAVPHNLESPCLGIAGTTPTAHLLQALEVHIGAHVRVDNKLHALSCHQVHAPLHHVQLVGLHVGHTCTHSPQSRGDEDQATEQEPGFGHIFSPPISLPHGPQSALLSCAL